MNHFYADDDNINRIGSDEWYWDQAESSLCDYDYDEYSQEAESCFDDEPVAIEDLIDPDAAIVTDTLSDFIGWLTDPEWIDAMQDDPLLDDEILACLREEPILSLQDPILSENDILALEDYLNDEDAFFASLAYEYPHDPELEMFFRTLSERDDA